MSDWRRFAREALRRLLEPECGPGPQLHEVITSLDDRALLHLVACPDLRRHWLALWSQGGGGSDLFEALLAASHPEPDLLGASQLASLAAWFASGRPITILTAGAAAIARGVGQEATEFLIALRGRGPAAQV